MLGKRTSQGVDRLLGYADTGVTASAKRAGLRRGKKKSNSIIEEEEESDGADDPPSITPQPSPGAASDSPSSPLSSLPSEPQDSAVFQTDFLFGEDLGESFGTLPLPDMS